MPDDERESPRAAIRSWLQSTETKSSKPRQTRADLPQEQRQQSTKTRYHPIGQASFKDDPVVDRAGTSATQDVDHRGHPDRGKAKDKLKASEHALTRDDTFQSNKARTHNHAVQRPEERGLAERLGLHAPFRTFKDRSDHEEVDLNALTRPRKRRRRKSSTESYLEPAEIHNRTESDHDGRSLVKTTEFKSNSHLRPKSCSEPNSESSVRTLPTPEKPSVLYERRPRHKTREDRYELKEEDTAKREKKRKASGNNLTKRKLKKPKRKEKSGAALMHDFSAQNVSNDRLTLQPAKSLGLFGKGRASSPVRRRGLPDLAFSELTFLNPHRQKPEEIANLSSTRSLEKNKPRKSTKAADTEAEISRYFTSTKFLDQDPSCHQAQQKQQKRNRSPQIRDSLPDFVDLPSTPFLGFGSCGVGSISPAKKPDSLALRDLKQKLIRSPSRTTSYLTWSQSEAPSQVLSRREKHEIVPLESSRLLNRRRSPFTSHQADLSRSASAPSRDTGNQLPRHRAEISVTPDQYVHCTASHSRGRCSPLIFKHSDGNKRLKQYQAIEKTESPSEHNSRHSGGDATQKTRNPKSSDLHHGNSRARPAEGLLSDRHEPSAKTDITPRPSLSGAEGVVNPLEIALEALLNGAKPTSRTNEPIATMTTDSVPQHLERTGVTNARHIHQPSRISSQDYGALPQVGTVPNREIPIAVPGSHIKRNIAHPRPSLETERSRYQKPSCAPLRSLMSSSSRPNNPIHAPNARPSSPNMRADSRSAWNGYGDMYEQQQIEYSAVVSDGEYLASHSNVDNGNYHTMDQENMAPSFLRRIAVHHHDQRGSAPYEQSNTLPLGDSRFEEEAPLEKGAWDAAEENLFAVHDVLYPPMDFDNGYDGDYLGYETFQGPHHQSHITPFPYRTAIIPSTQGAPNTSFSQWTHTPRRIAHSDGQGLAGNLTTIPGKGDDTAPSGFWTPHKLY